MHALHALIVKRQVHFHRIFLANSIDTRVLREKYHIQKYPTLKIFRKGVPLKSEYRGQVSLPPPPLLAYACQQSLDYSAVRDRH
jgi:hypothetical protein